MGLEIQSKEVIDKISEELKLQPALKIPRELMDKIQLVYSVNPPVVIQSVLDDNSDATSATVMTTSAVKDTYISAITLSVAKDVVSNSLHTQVSGTDFLGVAKPLIRIRYEPVTVGSFTETITFPIPIRLARGTNVLLQNNSGTASIDASCVVYFYEVDPQ